MCWESQVVSSDLRVLSCGWQDGTRGDPCYGRRAVWRKGGCLVPWDHVYWVRWVNTLPLMWDVNKELSPIIVGRFKKKKKKRFLFLKVYASKSYLESSDSWVKLNWVKVANQGQGTNNAAVLLCSSSVQVQDRPHFAGLFCKCWASFIDSSEVSFSFQTNARGCQASFTEKQDFGAYGNWAPYMTSTFISPILDFPVFIQCVRKSFKLKMPAVFTGNTQHVNSKRCQNRGSNALCSHCCISIKRKGIWKNSKYLDLQTD